MMVFFTCNPTHPIEGESKTTNLNTEKLHDEDEEKTFVSNPNIKIEDENKRDPLGLIE